MKITDTERLNFLQESTHGFGGGWIFRKSMGGRGMRLHETDQTGADRDVRGAIDKAMKQARDE